MPPPERRSNIASRTAGRRYGARLAWRYVRYALEAIRDGTVFARLDDKWRMLNKVTGALRSWNVPSGDYLEFGVYCGRSFVHAYKLVQYNGLDMHFYAFDSFQGLPTPTDEEKHADRFQEGQFACSEQTFKDNLKRSRVDLDKVTIVPGFYDESLTAELKQRLPLNRVSIAMIDCDLYSSTLAALEFMTDYLANGSVLIFDDWLSYAAMPGTGEMGAATEWLARNPNINLVEFGRYGHVGNSFLVQKS